MKFESFYRKLEFYKTLGIDPASPTFTIHPAMLGLSLDRINHKIKYLESIGMSLHDIKKATKYAPGFLSYSMDRRVPVLVEIFEELGLTQSDLVRMISKSPTIVGLSVRSIHNKIDTLRGLGFNTIQIGKLLRNSPGIMGYNFSEGSCLLRKFRFFFDELGLEHESLVKNTSLLGYDLKRRIRFRVFVAKRLGREFYTYHHILVPDEMFISRMGMTLESFKMLYAEYEKEISASDSAANISENCDQKQLTPCEPKET
eukprot:TRINITY_DN9189_c0_g1_i1.p1 TRINITY_DN9189_c0_g1~~TRINITY_DN9189_c0_g1_i1.p1  ORF type:complete len:257 (-),score=54.99 TRINITY_DN9189_c0_g1_i1:560-1330(-)